MFNSINWVQTILCRDWKRGTACKPSMKSLKSDPWTGPCFSQLFQIGLLYYLHALNIILYESKKTAFFFFFKQIPTALWDQIQLQCKWLVWPSVIHSVCVFVCVWLQWRYIYTEDQNHEPCWQPAASAARNKTRNKCFMKQTYTSLPYFSVTSLLPAAASNHLGFCTFSFNSNNFFRKVT